MATCVYDCAKCTLEVDKSLCCQFQTLRMLAEVKRMLCDSTPAPTSQKTIADLTESETDKTI